MAYRLEGKLLEVCTCNVLCPCWVGEDQDGGTCDGTLSWHMNGNWRAMVFLDEKASSQQEEAILNVFTGKLGGPVADFASLVGEVVGVERVPVTFEVEEGKGRLRLGSAVTADLEPFQGATGESTTLHDSIFTTIPGSPAYVGKAPVYKATSSALGLDIDLQNHNAVQGSFLFEG
jgi:hypothetical protein